MSFKFAKKIKKKNLSPPPPTKKVLRLPIRKKTCGVQTPFFVHLWFKPSKEAESVLGSI